MTGIIIKRFTVILLLLGIAATCTGDDPQKREKEAKTGSVLNGTASGESDKLEDGVRTFKEPVPYYVIAQDGLSLREKPEMSSKIITGLSFRTEVMAYKQLEKIDMVYDSVLQRNVKGSWYYVESGGYTGWVFGGYISKFRLTRKDLALARFAQKPFEDLPSLHVLNGTDILFGGRLSPEAEKIFGPSHAIKVQRIQNQYNPELYDELATVSFNEFDYKVYVTGETQTPLGVTIHPAAQPLSSGLTLRLNKEKIVEAFGTPSWTDRNILSYETVSEFPDVVTFVFDEYDQIAEIAITYYFE